MPAPALWADVLNLPPVAAGVHLFTPVLQVNTAANVIVESYTSTTGYSTANPAGPYTLTGNAIALDPFLQTESSNLAFEQSTVTLPAPGNLVLPSISNGSGGVTAEGLEFYQ